MPSKDMKNNFTTSLILRKMQIKITIRHHYISTKLAKILNYEHNKHEVEKRGFIVEWLGT